MIQPDFTSPIVPISEFAGRPDFPQCALGAHVDIGGSTGVVMEIVRQSVKLKSAEGATLSFNTAWLRKIYGPTPKPEMPPVETREVPEPSRKSLARESSPPPPPPKREVIESPDFTQEVVSIRGLTPKPDFPRCAYGKYVEINGYSGVVVEIVGRSLKVRSPEETTRSYNADVLRKLYNEGQGAPPPKS